MAGIRSGVLLAEVQSIKGLFRPQQGSSIFLKHRFDRRQSMFRAFSDAVVSRSMGVIHRVFGLTTQKLGSQVRSDSGSIWTPTDPSIQNQRSGQIG